MIIWIAVATFESETQQNVIERERLIATEGDQTIKKRVGV